MALVNYCFNNNVNRLQDLLGCRNFSFAGCNVPAKTQLVIGGKAVDSKGVHLRVDNFSTVQFF